MRRVPLAITVLALLAATAVTATSAGADPAGAGSPDLCVARKLGWHFYCDPEKAEAVLEDPAPTPSPPPDPRQRIAAIRDKLDVLKATAILDPTPDNLVAYIRFQREQLDRASLFSDQWRRTVWRNPELDYDLVRPTGTLAKRAWSDARRRDAAAALAALPERYGVFYFFKAGCPQCRAFETALRPFVETHGLHLMAVSLDGSPSPAFPYAVADSGQAARLGVTGEHLPALALFDSGRNRVIPVGFGALAADELERRIYVLTQLEVGDDY
ncbi:MAG: conjugal transfer protein TraF [Alphaproteobacteria bacterium]|nr:conjugal transfer protein TraF [Alphaproteobacteria bacterium]